MSADPNTSARRCTGCDVNWPPVDLYKMCPGCGCETWLASRTQPIGVKEACDLASDLTLSRQRHEEFEQFYADREAKRLREELDQFAGSP